MTNTISAEVSDDELINLFVDLFCDEKAATSAVYLVTALRMRARLRSVTRCSRRKRRAQGQLLSEQSLETSFQGVMLKRCEGLCKHFRCHREIDQSASQLPVAQVD